MSSGAVEPGMHTSMCDVYAYMLDTFQLHRLEKGPKKKKDPFV